MDLIQCYNNISVLIIGSTNKSFRYTTPFQVKIEKTQIDVKEIKLILKRNKLKSKNLENNIHTKQVNVQKKKSYYEIEINIEM